MSSRRLADVFKANVSVEPALNKPLDKKMKVIFPRNVSKKRKESRAAEVGTLSCCCSVF